MAKLPLLESKVPLFSGEKKIRKLKWDSKVLSKHNCQHVKIDASVQGVPFGLIKKRSKDLITSSPPGTPNSAVTGDGGSR